MARYYEAETLLEFVKQNTPHINGETTMECVEKAIKEAPTVDDEEVKHGQWLPQIVLGERVWDCSECKTIGSPHWKRCPVCEAKMKEGENNGDL